MTITLSCRLLTPAWRRAIKSVEFIPATAQNSSEILSLIPEFFKVEPHITAMNLSHDSIMPRYCAILENAIKHPYSFVMKDKTTRESFGFRLMTVATKDSPEEFNGEINCPKAQIMVDLVDHVRMETFKKLPDVEKVLRLEVAFIHPRFQGLGIAHHLIHKNLDFSELRKQGIEGITSAATSLSLQKILEEHGYKKIVDLEKSIYDQHNIRLTDGTPGVQGYFLDIRKLTK